MCTARSTGAEQTHGEQVEQASPVTAELCQGTGDLCQHSPVHLGTSSPSPGQGQHQVLDSTAKQDIPTSTLIVKLSSNMTWSQQGQAWAV